MRRGVDFHQSGENKTQGAFKYQLLILQLSNDNQISRATIQS